MKPTTEQTEYVLELAKARGLRLLKHPSASHDGRWKLKDRNGEIVLWPSPLCEVRRFLDGKPQPLADQLSLHRSVGHLTGSQMQDRGGHV